VPGLGPVALAFLKTAVAEPGTPVVVGGINGVVSPLPFPPPTSHLPPPISNL
jgi:hypothetical protein